MIYSVFVPRPALRVHLTRHRPGRCLAAAAAEPVSVSDNASANGLPSKDKDAEDEPGNFPLVDHLLFDVVTMAHRRMHVPGRGCDSGNLYADFEDSYEVSTLSLDQVCYPAKLPVYRSAVLLSRSAARRCAHLQSHQPVLVGGT
jgi:hypothetical protein